MVRTVPSDGALLRARTVSSANLFADDLLGRVGTSVPRYTSCISRRSSSFYRSHTLWPPSPPPTSGGSGLDSWWPSRHSERIHSDLSTQSRDLPVGSWRVASSCQWCWVPSHPPGLLLFSVLKLLNLTTRFWWQDIRAIWSAAGVFRHSPTREEEKPIEPTKCGELENLRNPPTTITTAITLFHL